MTIDRNDFRVPGGRTIRLTQWATDIRPLYKSEKQYQELLIADVRELSALQRLLYASNSYAVLLIFQAMDAAGKDGAISHVLSGVNPQGCDVHSFKHPSAEELAHDFLWRTTCCLPARGRIGIFNRSYYEEVLIVRVHPAILRSERVPGGKFSQADVAERRFWNQYMTAYQDCLSATSTHHAPWHVVPADDKYNARLIISRVVIDALQGLKMSEPKTTRARRHELRAIRRQLADKPA